MSLSSPTNPLAPRRAFPRTSLSAHRNPQRGPGRLTDSAARTNVVLLICRTVRPREYASGFNSPAASLTVILSILHVTIVFPQLARSKGGDQCEAGLLPTMAPVAQSIVAWAVEERGVIIW